MGMGLDTPCSFCCERQSRDFHSNAFAVNIGKSVHVYKVICPKAFVKNKMLNMLEIFLTVIGMEPLVLQLPNQAGKACS